VNSEKNRLKISEGHKATSANTCALVGMKNDSESESFVRERLAPFRYPSRWFSITGCV
jgi:hypothetical protein